MTLNPELKRNLWLELSLERLIAMPVVLGLLFWVMTLVSGHVALASVSIAAFHLLVLLWGSRRAARGVSDELRAGTWDDQRMSPIDAWSMAWGKLVGATIFVWYGGAFCLAVFIGARVQQGGFLTWDNAVINLSFMTSLIVLGLLAQSVALTASLAFLQKRRLERRLSVTFSQIIGLAVAAYAGALVFREFFIDLGTMAKFGETIRWFGHGIDFMPFALLSLGAFLGWAFLGLYRLMQVELQYRIRPWAWVCFSIFAMVYAAGLLHDELVSNHLDDLLKLVVPFVIAAAGVYLIFFLEPKNTVQLRKWIAAVQGRSWSGFWRLTPNWILALALLWIVGLLQIVILIGQDVQLPEPVRWLGVSIGEVSSIWVFAVLLFVCRDILLLLYLNLSRTKGKPDTTGIIYLAVLYGLLPP
ncbi:MAG TPA: hypothetical protein DCS82_05710, partial [Rhodospirillaceae bacterium]|nr:hypothetical protein [Rhodospirillaceae bacterium]